MAVAAVTLLPRKEDRGGMRAAYAPGQPFVSGETVTAGKFRCRECGYEHEVERGVVNLPICPRCLNDTWDPG